MHTYFVKKLNISNNFIFDGKSKHYDVIINCLPINVDFLRVLESNEIDYKNLIQLSILIT